MHAFMQLLSPAGAHAPQYRHFDWRFCLKIGRIFPKTLTGLSLEKGAYSVRLFTTTVRLSMSPGFYHS
jgi:hypothetical protein